MADNTRKSTLTLAKRLIVDLLWKTANIEVDGITFPDVQEIYEGRAPAGMKVDDIVAVNNLKQGLQFVIDKATQASLNAHDSQSLQTAQTTHNTQNARSIQSTHTAQGTPLDLPVVSRINSIVGQGLIHTPGELRTTAARMGGIEWAPAIPRHEDVIRQLHEVSLIDDPEERAIAQFCTISRGQWFNDGNKRTALLAANLTLITEGVGILAISPKAKRAFVATLLSFYESGDRTELTAWLRRNTVGLIPGGLTRAEQDRNQPTYGATASVDKSHANSPTR